ncbi:MAG: hypothetical protein UT53_C0014G0002 [Candidatus Yanofskybacteria bacterium GW2011_GWD2_39_48]|uniref:Uncharacterized protein n=1 Tax=Candidatus Yanofskybacteria bacterium GW2011_GWD2_39_48 TaxID=1619031 RepID=A0A0G0P5J8_9BACT|nr:MAG: hypothetical protein UT53_C0014G0002 [Candidatus Yanofskybacteria bacterium GW2011_GWD2_39_48]
MSKEKLESEGKKDPFLIEQILYTADESPEFNEYLKSREHLVARQDNLSEVTEDKVLMSGWHVPCHCIITRTPEGKSQAFHIQPNKAGSFLTFEQEKALREMGTQKASAIVSKGIRSWFGRGDEIELENMHIKLERVVDVDTSNWWRLLYDPKTNELWIDIKDKKVLKKYKGF